MPNQKAMFPKPWSYVWCGDSYRIYDANDRHLFVITSDEFDSEDEDPKTATVLQHGSEEEQAELCKHIELLFPEKE